MANEHRTKTYLTQYVKNMFVALEPSALGFTDDFKIEVRGEGPNWVQLSIKDPTDGMPRYFEVKVTQKV